MIGVEYLVRFSSCLIEKGLDKVENLWENWIPVELTWGPGWINVEFWATTFLPSVDHLTRVVLGLHWPLHYSPCKRIKNQSSEGVFWPYRNRRGRGCRRHCTTSALSVMSTPQPHMQGRQCLRCDVLTVQHCGTSWPLGFRSPLGWRCFDSGYLTGTCWIRSLLITWLLGVNIRLFLCMLWTGCQTRWIPLNFPVTKSRCM
jgi:hypothetical protein